MIDRTSGALILTRPLAGAVFFVLISASSSLVFIYKSGFSAESDVALPIIFLPLALVGFWDDRLNLPVALRYGVQFTTALILIRLSPLFIPLLLPVFILVITAIINFINFMDGLDGLCAGCLAVAIATAAFVLRLGSIPWLLVGSLLGFLCWNWSPAKVFMGDVGSTFLGAVFADLVLQAPSWPEALGLLLVATPLLGDACLCVPRRLHAGQRVFQAHRLHLFQRLHQAGWSHARVSSLYIAATALLAMALLIGGWPSVVALAAAELLTGVWLDQRLAVPFAVASRS